MIDVPGPFTLSSGSSVILPGTMSFPPVWCQPAPSRTSTACALGATLVLMTFRCSFIAMVFMTGMTIAAATPRAGHIAPNR